MTEQELREKFEKIKNDNGCIGLLNNEFKWFQKGYSLAQETIEKQKKEIKELTSKIYEAYSMQASIAKNDLTSTGVHLKIQQLDHEQMIKAKDADIERLKESKIITELLIDEKDKAIAEARELLSDLRFERLMDDCRCEHCRYLEKAKTWLENNC